MLYYKVKPECDGKQIVTIDKNGNIKYRDVCFVGGELYTPAEYKRLYHGEKVCIPVERKKTETYWLFGARFHASDLTYSVIRNGDKTDKQTFADYDTAYKYALYIMNNGAGRATVVRDRDGEKFNDFKLKVRN